jgi:hypothetical protein
MRDAAATEMERTDGTEIGARHREGDGVARARQLRACLVGMLVDCISEPGQTMIVFG